MSVSSRIALCVGGIDGRCPQQKEGVISERILFQRWSRFDETKDNVASDYLEGEVDQVEAYEEMVLEEEPSRCEKPVQ